MLLLSELCEASVKSVLLLFADRTFPLLLFNGAESKEANMNFKFLHW